MTQITRRTALKLGAALALTSHTPAIAAPPSALSVDEFLAKASPSERAWYHATALAEAMGEIDPSRAYVATVNRRLGYAHVAGYPIEDKTLPVAKVHIDDGSPLLADDVTGTTAFADWEGGRS